MSSSLIPPFSIDQANTAFRLGDLETVATMALTALKHSPNNPDWLNMLATAYAMTGRSLEASKYFHLLVEMNPDNDTSWSNLGNALCDAKLYSQATDALQKATSINPKNSYAHFALARAYQILGQAKPAIKHARHAVQIAPNDDGFKILLANLKLWLDDWDGALAELSQLQGRRMSAQQLVDIADLYLQMNLYDISRSKFNSALIIQPNSVDALLGLGLLEERVNALPAAQACADKVSALSSTLDDPPWLPRLKQLRARLAFRNKKFQESADLLTDLIAYPSSNPILQSHLYFELGTSQDQLGNTELAWKAFYRAHAVRSEHLSHAHKSVAGTDLLEILENQLPKIPKKDAILFQDTHRDPIFIVGFPRSGTTLLEQILDSQAGLASFDEQPFLQLLLVQLRKLGLSYPADMASIDNTLNGNFRKAYFNYVHSVVPNLGTRRPVDKSPLNLVRLPFAEGFLPDSKVILAIRHPCDVVLSCFMQSFRTPILATSFSSLETTAELYARVMLCWRGFRDQLRLPTYINRYEDLVTNPVKATQDLAAFLQLPWSDSWLNAANHAQNKGAIRTPSYVQVTEPINQKAKGRWLRYRAHFSDTTLSHLAPWIAEFGYPSVE